MKESGTPFTEADLHAYADGQLPDARRLEVEAWLAQRPGERERVRAWMGDNEALRERLGVIAAEAIPVRIPTRRAPAPQWRQFAAAASIALVSAGLGWFSRGMAGIGQEALVASAPAARNASLAAFADRAAIAHVVYSPEVRRPVEVAADKEDQLVAWLSKRLEAPIKAPNLVAQGYELIGGRLLPGERGPAAQFMYHDGTGQRVTLYVARDVQSDGLRDFRFEKSGPVNVFYWTQGPFGYAISAGIEKIRLEALAREVQRQVSL